jgi:two-component system, NarL family, response regulator NreC
MKIVIVDDHVVFRNGIRFLLSALPAWRIVGEAGTAREAFSIVDEQQPDLVLLDLSLPGIDGVVATPEILRRSPRTRVLVLSVHDQIRDVLDALNAGVSGYALKSESSEALIGALRTVARGERYLAPAVEARLGAYQSRRRAFSDVLEVLSGREREVFRLAAQCLTAREVAGQLCISRKTVDTHLYRIHRKLGLRSSAELIRLAAELGLVHQGPARATEISNES